MPEFTAVAVGVAVNQGRTNINLWRFQIGNVAEGEGFEPPKACTLVVFKTGRA
jgi:hypothetical protein